VCVGGERGWGGKVSGEETSRAFYAPSSNLAIVKWLFVPRNPNKQTHMTHTIPATYDNSVRT